MNEKEGETTKKVFAGFLTAALLLGLLSVGASAAETKYEPLTLTDSSGASAMTIDKARVTHVGREGWYSIYAIPDGAKVTVTFTDIKEGREFYIGVKFDLLSDGGNANTGGMGMKTAEYILNAENMLQRVYAAGSNSETLEKDDSWVGSPGAIKTNGTYSFTIPTAEYVGWNLSIMYGGRMGPHFPESDPEKFHGFLMDGFSKIRLEDGSVDEERYAAFIVESATGDNGNPFTDLLPGTYCYDEVLWAVKKGITAGKTANTFAPGETCSKAQILTFLWRANGEPEPSAANPFTDVTQSNYYYKAALWAAEQGLVSGSAFDAPLPCTRAMTVEYLWTLAGKPETEKSTAFTDVPADAAYAKAVAWAVEKGVTTGKTDDTFAPDAVCTRGQIATFLHRAMG